MCDILYKLSNHEFDLITNPKLSIYGVITDEIFPIECVKKVVNMQLL